MLIVNVGSGSKGNCTLIFNKNKECICVDAGISKRRIATCLKALNFSFENISALLLTHQHSDHFSQHKNFKDEITYQPFQLQNDQSEEVHLLNGNATFNIGSFKIHGFYVNHDSRPTMNYIIEADDEKLAIITDTGFIHEEIFPELTGLDYYMMESNYDDVMLLDSDRDFALKKRIMSDLGHLSNTQASVYLTKFISNNTKQIMLIHLSEECNTKDIASSTYYKEMLEIFDNIPKIKLKLANQHKPTYIGTKLDYLNDPTILENNSNE